MHLSWHRGLLARLLAGCACRSVITPSSAAATVRSNAVVRSSVFIGNHSSCDRRSTLRALTRFRGSRLLCYALLATDGPKNYRECSVAAWLTTIHATIMNQGLLRRGDSTLSLVLLYIY